MTELLYHSESYLKQFEATVTDVVAGGVVLNRTAFYVGGGGQPADSGVLTVGNREYSVTGIKRVDGQFVHLISGELPSQSSIVKGQIDWERRYLLMRTHSALHIL